MKLQRTCKLPNNCRVQLSSTTCSMLALQVKGRRKQSEYPGVSALLIYVRIDLLKYLQGRHDDGTLLAAVLALASCVRSSNSTMLPSLSPAWAPRVLCKRHMHAQTFWISVWSVPASVLVAALDILNTMHAASCLVGVG